MHSGGGRMYEQGTVTAVKGEIITIKCGKPEQCKSCSSSFCNVKTKNFRAFNRESLDLKEGDEVEVYVSPGKTIAYSFIVLIFPLLMFVAGYFISGTVFGVNSDPIKALFGLAGLAAGFILSFLFNSIRKNHNLPVITGKIE
jgi:sigma-E factor negative regulatory protein RseC